MTETKKQNDKKAIEPALFRWIRKQYELRPSVSLLNLFKKLFGLRPTPKKNQGWEEYNQFMYDHAIEQLTSGAPSPLLYTSGENQDRYKNDFMFQPKENIFQKQLSLLQKYNFRFTSSSASITRILDKITKLHLAFGKITQQSSQLNATPKCNFHDYALKNLTTNPTWLTINPDDQAIIMKICQNDELMKKLCILSPKPMFPNFQMNNLLPKSFSANQLFTNINPFGLTLKPKLNRKSKSHKLEAQPSIAASIGN